MAHRRQLALVLAAALAAGLIALVASAAGAQTTLSRLVFVNGASADPVDVVVNGATFATELEFAAATDPYVGEAGDYAITYSTRRRSSVRCHPPRHGPSFPDSARTQTR